MRRRHRFRGATMLVVRQSDGTLAQIPEWMCAPAAAAAEVREAARLPLRVLRGLRLAADEALASLPQGGGGRDGASRTGRTAGAVRGGAGGGPRLTPEVRRALLVLLEALLREAAAEGPAGREGGDEQDHA